MRRGTLEKPKERKPQPQPIPQPVIKQEPLLDFSAAPVKRTNTVEDVLNMFKSGNYDVNQAVMIVVEGEAGNQDDMVAALEQISDILCGIGHFQKAYDLLDAAFKPISKSSLLHELIARVAYVMENYEKCIFHNKKAAEMKPGKCCANNSDIGLAYYHLARQQKNNKNFELAFKHCRMALSENSKYANAMVNMGLIYRNENSSTDAQNMFQAALAADSQNRGAIVNLGTMEYEKGNHEMAALRFLDALNLKGDDEEALCNLALALKKTPYLEFTQTAFEEAINVSPGNTFILQNYLLFLLEKQKFEQFQKFMTHAKRVMEKQQIDVLSKLYDEFKVAIEGCEGKVLPEDSLVPSTPASADLSKIRRGLTRGLTIKKEDKGNQLQVIEEEDN